MKWLVGGFGFIMALIGGVNLGAATGDKAPAGADFVYDEATTEEREDWLNTIATKLEGRAKREAGASMYVSFEEVKVLHSRREIQTVLKLGSYFDFKLEPNTLKEAKDAGCPFLIQTGLYANNGKWTQKLVKSSGQTAFSFTLSRSNCASYSKGDQR